MTAFENRAAVPHRVVDAIADVWVIDPHPIVRAGIRSQLGSGGFAVGWEGAALPGGAEAPAGGKKPDIVIMDASLGGHAVSALKQRFPEAHPVVFAGAAELSSLAEAFAAGADGYVLKSISAAALIDSLRLVMHGEKVFPRTLGSLIGQMHAEGGAGVPREACATRVGDVWLAPREQAILNGLVQGLTNKRIANSLGITEATVKVNLKAVLRKLGLSNRTQVAIWAIQHQFSGASTEECPAATGPACRKVETVQ
ncbi:MAG: LuxR C-terminal-related transcriptional regulator [Alphaproteobacteria bacterium]